MPLGDSITQGDGDPGVQGAYRNQLYTVLNSAGYNLDFVGTFTDPNNPGLPDDDHQGLPGVRVDEMNNLVGGWLDSVEDPDVILLLVGTNDFLQTWRNETPAGVLGELDSLITNIATRRPFAKIIVSTLVLSTVNSSIESKQVTFNQGIPGLVADHVAIGHQVTMVDMHSVLNSGDLYDNVHPTPAGYNKLGNAWLPAITSVISTKGTANAPQIAWADTSNDLTKVSVTFSKPVADSATTLANFNISGGVTVSGASLDAATKRTITLTTSSQTPGEVYTLTVSGVRDRTTQQTLIAPVSRVLFYPNILTNGSFESSYAGWTTHTGNQEISQAYAAPDGVKMVAFNTSNSFPNGVLSQSFNTKVGETYSLSFQQGIATWQYGWIQRMNVKVQDGTTLLGTTLLDTTSVISGSANSGTNGTLSVRWFPWVYQFTAISSMTTLTFTDACNTVTHTSRDMLLDNVWIAQAEHPATLAVTSTANAGANITITPADLNGIGNGPTGLIRSYDAGTAVTLTAPATASGKNFLRWQINGANIAGTNRTATVTLDENTRFNAVYDSSGGAIAPVAVADSYMINEDTTLAVSVSGVLHNDSDVNAATLTAVLSVGPTHGSLALNSNGSFNYTPVANYNGPDSFTYRANNGTLNSNTTTVSISVAAINDPPVAVNNGSPGSPYRTIAEDSGITSTMTVLTNDTDVDGDALSITEASSQNGSVDITNLNTRLQFTPAANFNGPTTISYTISDGNGGTATAITYISVTPVNDAPVANAQSGSLDEGNNLAITLTGSDVEGQNLIFAKGSPSNGTLTGTAPNLTYTPAANYFGPDSFTFTVSDGTLISQPATVSITVNPINDAPVAIAQSIAVNEDNTLAITLTGTDVDNVNLAFAKGSPLHGTLTGIPPNLTYTPVANYNGPDSFTFTASDGTLTSSPATVSITVNAVNDTPVAFAQSVSVNEDGTLAITLTGTDVETSSLNFAKTSPAHGALTGTAPNLTYTPATHYNGPDSFTFTVSDGVLTSTSATISISVNPVNDAPVASAQTVATNEDTPLGITLSGSDIDGDTLTTFSVTVQPLHGTLTGTGANRTYTPDANYTGPDNFSFKVSDAALQSVAAAMVSISVNPVNDAPVASAQTVATNEDTPLGITLSGSDIDGDTLTTFSVTVQP
ncbi:MAG: tandem-95 repeat protein, partial [Opitutaceae bacterium]|nr:tandem-95 repeat protein [Verrucomicrobiales bacterium]